MSQTNTNWLFGKDDPDDLSVFIEGFSRRMQADFVQLLASPQQDGSYRQCYTIPATRNFSRDAAVQHKRLVEQFVDRTSPRLYDNTQPEAEFPETSFFRKLAYRRLLYIPILRDNRPIGLLCSYYLSDAVPDASIFDGITRELTLLLGGRAGNHGKGFEPVTDRVSRELTHIRNRKQLADWFAGPLQDLLGYKNATIFLLQHDTHSVENIFGEFQNADGNYPFQDRLRLGKNNMDRHFANAWQTVAAAVEFDDFDAGSDLFPLLVKPGEQLSHGVIYNLYGGDEIVGKWILLFATDNWMLHPGKLALQQIAGQLTLVVARIQVTEKWQRLQEEEHIVSALNLDLSSTRDKHSLLHLMHQKLSNLFDFSHTVVGLINEDDCSFQVFLRDTNSRSRNHPLFETLAPVALPLVDGVLNKVLLSREPLTFDLEECRARGITPDYIIMWYESGIRKATICTLQVRSKTIGFWAICHLEGQNMTTGQRELMKNISSQLSIAVDNISANELISAKNAETESLLQLSFALTHVQTVEELKNTLRSGLPRLINFRELVLRIVNSKMDSRCLLAINTADPAAEAVLQTADAHESAFAPGQSEEAWVFDVAGLLSKAGAPSFLLDEYNRGIREKAIFRLPIEDDQHVSIALHFDKKGASTDDTLQLFKSISYQLSFIINTILANARTTAREAERDLLLSLSGKMARVRNGADLLQLINGHMKPIIGFAHTLIGIVNHDQETFEPILPDGTAPWRSNPLLRPAQHRSLPLHDGLLDVACGSPEPNFVDLAPMSGKPNLPVYLQQNIKSGIKQVITVRLGNAEKPSGLWLIFMDRPVPYCDAGANFLDGIGAQLSGALFNIASNAHIEQREVQKDRLITFNQKIASVREKGPLARVFGEQLRDLLDIAGYVFLEYSGDKTRCFPSLSWLDSGFATNTELMLTGCDFSTGSPLLEKIAANDGPINIDLQDAAADEPANKLLRITRDNGWERVSAQVLKIGEQKFGIVFIWPRRNYLTDYQASLWKGVSAQMATAIANLLANEKISAQLEEIKLYKARLEEEKIYLKEEIETTRPQFDIIGDSPEIKKVYRLLTQVAPSDSTVLILGETGTGKEVFARAIHNNSPRKGKLMVKVNCAALPANLIESELFGHEKGSFTGATERRIGKFELAGNGTLFLDEIGEMPLELQAKLLRALQEKEIERIGGRTPIKVDVRIIAATNRDLEREMQEKRFRSDLFYRLNIFPVQLPPLRKRKDDIRALALHFVETFSKKTGKKITNISSRVLNQLQEYHWPGNIRELEHTIERSVLLSHGNTLQQIDLPPIKSLAALGNGDMEGFIPYTIDENEQIHILRVLKLCNGKINGPTGAAAILGVPPSTLNSKMKRLNIRKMHHGNAAVAEH